MSITGQFINLDRSTGRRDHMLAEAARVGITLTRLPAVDGAAMTETNYTRWHPAAGAMHRLSRAEVACFLSHRKAWQDVVAGDARFGAVFEDDLLFADNAALFFDDDTWIPYGADLIKIETTSRKVMLQKPLLVTHDHRKLGALASTHLGGGGYILSRDFAARLLQATEPITVPVDYALFSPDLAAIDGASVWQLSPAICVQQVRTRTKFLPDDAEASGLDSARAGLKRKGLAKLIRELWRPFETLFFELRKRMKAALRNQIWVLIRFR